MLLSRIPWQCHPPSTDSTQARGQALPFTPQGSSHLLGQTSAPGDALLSLPSFHVLGDAVNRRKTKQPPLCFGSSSPLPDFIWHLTYWEDKSEFHAYFIYT